MKDEYERLISEHDKTLTMLRGHWLKANVENKSDWWERINSALDERLRLMGLRDNTMATA